MGNNTSLYIGAYLKIEVGKITRMGHLYVCSNGHRTTSGPFCAQCGAPSEKELISDYAADLYDLLPHVKVNEFEDILVVTTPPSLFRTGVVIATGNRSSAGHWCRYWPGDEGLELEALPTDEQIAGMKAEFEREYAGLISLLRKAPLVRSATVEAGIVLDAEY